MKLYFDLRCCRFNAEEENRVAVCGEIVGDLLIYDELNRYVTFFIIRYVKPYLVPQLSNKVLLVLSYLLSFAVCLGNPCTII
jgi:hypothetical protein